MSAAAESALKTEDAAIGMSLSSTELAGLPQLSRDPYELIRLTPGVFGDGARSGGGNSVGLPNTTGPGGSNVSIFQTENQVPISANGQRLSNNNFMVDGVSVNSLTWGGAAVVTPNQESVKGITVQSSAYSAEYGRNSGAQVEVVSKNGTNELHGSGFFKFNEPGLNAFNRYGGVDAPPVRVENNFRQWGGSLGGPILKNRLFYFFSYEGLRNNTNDFQTAWVETPQYRQSVITLRPNSVTAQIFQSPGVQPRIASVLDAGCPQGFAPGTCQKVAGGLDIGSLMGAAGTYVDTGQNPTGGGLDGIPDIQFVQLSNPNRIFGNQYNGRIDYSHGMDSFAFSTYLTPRSDTLSNAAGRDRPMADVMNTPLNSAYFLSYNRTISPTSLNQVRFNLTRFSSNQVAASSQTNFGIPRLEVEGLPFDRIRFGADRAETTPAIFAQNTFEVNDTYSKVFNRHALKAGFLVRREQNNNNLAGGARPLYSFQGLFNLANGTPIFEAINANPSTGQPADAQRYLRSTDFGWFVQDDWKVRPNLTVNLGLRYEYFSPLTETRGRLSNLFFGTQGLQNSQIQTVDRLYNPDWNNFAPRLGFAYSPGYLHSNAVIRGGFWVAYDRIPGSVFSNSAGNPPSFARYNICCGTATTSFSTPFAGGQILYALGANNSPSSYPINPALATGIDPVTGAPRGSAVEIWSVNPNERTPYVYVWSLDTEYRLPHNLIASVGYQGSAGHKLIRLVNQNYLYQNNPAFFAVYAPQTDVNSNFNALLVGLRRRYANGLDMALNYRWSKSIDTLSYEGPGAVTNQTYPMNLSTERGPSDYDATHYVNLTSIYDLPFYKKQQGFLGKLAGGFSLSGILNFHSGFPWTAKTGQSVSTPGGPSLSPTRPVAYFGGALTDPTTDAFIRPGGNFPNGGSAYFDITHSGFPGIGRNSFRGPRYFTTDFSFKKLTKLSASKWLGENAGIEFRANIYNAFNKLNLAPLGFFSPGTFIENNQFFGRSDAGLAGRVVELQARFSF